MLKNVGGKVHNIIIASVIKIMGISDYLKKVSGTFAKKRNSIKQFLNIKFYVNIEDL